MKSKLDDGQCGFPSGCSTMALIIERSWEYGKDLFACFVDLEKAQDRVIRYKRWRILLEYSADG